MENIEAYKRKLSAIGEAIRTKTGKTDLLDLDEMATEIEGIEVGGNNTALIEGTITEVVNHEATKVRSYGFYNCTSLERVDLPNVTEVGSTAFRYTGIKDLYLPKLQIVTNSYVFASCPNLESVNLPMFNDNAGNDFNACPKLKHVLLPSMPDINANMFSSCTALEEVSFPKVTIVYSSAFSGCTALKKVVFDKSVGFIRQTIFNNCSALTALVLKGETLSGLSYTNVFQNTPIENGTGYIYVPKALIEQYKVATNWITFAEQFRAIEDYPEICGGAAE